MRIMLCAKSSFVDSEVSEDACLLGFGLSFVNAARTRFFCATSANPSSCRSKMASDPCHPGSSPLSKRLSRSRCFFTVVARTSALLCSRNIFFFFGGAIMEWFASTAIAAAAASPPCPCPCCGGSASTTDDSCTAPTADAAADAAPAEEDEPPPPRVPPFLLRVKARAELKCPSTPLRTLATVARNFVRKAKTVPAFRPLTSVALSAARRSLKRS